MALKALGGHRLGLLCRVDDLVRAEFDGCWRDDKATAMASVTSGGGLERPDSQPPIAKKV